MNSAKPYCLFPRTPFLFSSLNVQKNMLQDKNRLNAFHEAIKRTVQPGDIVIDLGTGTGILAIWAAQSGAKKVYAIEETDAATAAESVIRTNGLDGRITVLRANSNTVRLPERADVLIAELVGHFLFEEGIVEYIADMRDSWLKPKGRIIPSSADIFLAPLNLGDSFEEISFWEKWTDPDLSPISDLAANSAYVESIGQENLLATPELIFEEDFTIAGPSFREKKGSFSVTRQGIFDALGGWFHLRLCEGVSINTGPESPPTHWKQCVFPLKKPIPVMPGDELSYFFQIEPFGPGSKWCWQVGRRDQGTGLEKHEFAITHPGSQILFLERF